MTDRRSADLEAMVAAVGSDAVRPGSRSVVTQGDALNVLPLLPDACASLILTDPPYHSTKKANIFGDRDFAEDEHYLEWLRSIALEWRRVLRRSGALYVFCSPSMAGRIEVSLSEFFRPVSHITWTKPNEPGFDGWKGKMKKEALRTWYPHSERLLMFEHAGQGNPFRSILGEFLKDRREAAGLSQHKLTGLIGAFGKVNHGGAVSNWEAGRNLPSREQYERICEALEATNRIDPMPAYEDVVRPFAMAGHLQYTDVWDFPSVRPYKGKHPAEKPVELLRHVVEATTYEGDIVLDCFAGSGATGVAALMANRRAFLVEIEEKWAQRSAERLAEAETLSPHSSLASARARRAEADVDVLRTTATLF